MKTVEAILEDAAALPPDDQWALLERLWETVGSNRRPPLFDDPAFRAEIERRATDESPGIPWEEIKARAKAS